MTDPKWAAMHTEADNLVRSGELTAEKAAAYKCDPSLIYADIKNSLDRNGLKVQVVKNGKAISVDMAEAIAVANDAEATADELDEADVVAEDSSDPSTTAAKRKPKLTGTGKSTFKGCDKK